jgi:hypothetical protein
LLDALLFAAERNFGDDFLGAAGSDFLTGAAGSNPKKNLSDSRTPLKYELMGWSEAEKEVEDLCRYVPGEGGILDALTQNLEVTS